MNRAKNILDRLLKVVSVILFIAMVLLTTYQVIARYIFKSPSSISEVLTRYAFVWLILVSATYVFGQRDHIAITFLRDKFSGIARKGVDIAIEGVIILFSATIMVYGGFTVTQMNMLQYDSMLNIPTGFVYCMIPICGVLTILYSIYNIILEIRSKEE